MFVKKSHEHIDFFLLLSENDITQEAWKKKVESALDHGHDLYPTYEKIVEYLQKHRPEAISLTANDCCVSMQVSVTPVVEFEGAEVSCCRFSQTLMY